MEFNSQNIANFILAITGIVIAWYSFETHKMRKGGIKPILAFYIRRIDGTDKLRLRNIGVGTAVDILIERVEILSLGILCNFTIEENFLVSGQEVDVSFEARNRNNEVDIAGIVFDDCPLYLADFTLRVTYKDIEGKSFDSATKRAFEGNRLTLKHS